jgi:nucleotide-binding universal stress UspA family protein
MKKLLVCTDGSSYSEVCCEYAAWLAARHGSAVDVLYVTDLRQYEMPMMADLSGSIGAQPYQNLVGQLQEIENLKRESVEQVARKVFEMGGFTGELGFIHRGHARGRGRGPGGALRPDHAG